jgi:phosphoglycolate phosphatase
MEAFIGHYDNSDYPNTHLLPGVRETLDGLKTRAIPCFIVSNKRRIPMLRILDNLKIKEYFLDIYNPDMFADRGISKTKPELIADLVASRRLINKNTAYVGDMEIDVLAAKENGLVAVAVVNGYGNTKKFSAKPDYVIKRILDVLTFL